MSKLLSKMGKGDGVAQAKFRLNLEDAVRSAAPGVPCEAAPLAHCQELVRHKEVTAGDALSCFKEHFRSGVPDEQYKALLVLEQIVNSDPHLAGQLHAELASKRWRERFVALAASHHPDVKPRLVNMLQQWAANYHSHDIGLHYNGTIREIQTGIPAAGRTGSGRYMAQLTGAGAGAGYSAQHTGYSAQHTGYSAQHTGYPPGPAGYGYPHHPPPSMAYPAAGGYPPPPFPPPTYGTANAMSPRRPDAGAGMPGKLDALNSDMDTLRDRIAEADAALQDYKSGKVAFSTLSGALERGARIESRVSSNKQALEAMLGSSELKDEALTSRMLTAMERAVALTEQWNRLSNQELAPPDIGPTDAAPRAGPAAATSAAPAAAPPPAAKPAVPVASLIDLLMDDAPMPAAAPPSAANGVHASPAPTSGLGLPSTSSGGVAAAPPYSLFLSPPVEPVVPAESVEGLKAQVLGLMAELEKQRKMQQTAVEAQEAFHRAEIAQVKQTALVRVNELTTKNAELEAAVARMQQQLASAGLAHAGAFPLAAAGPSGSQGGGGALPPPGPAPPALGIYNPFNSLAAPAAAAAPPPSMFSPFAAASTTPAPPPASAGPMFDAFDELAAASIMHIRAGTSASVPDPAPLPAAVAAMSLGAAPATGAPPPRPDTKWVNFGH